MDNSKIIYLHGLESTSQSGKARQFAQLFPGMITPDFTGSFEERMEQLPRFSPIKLIGRSSAHPLVD